MRKVVAYQLVSLDGVAEDPDQFITDWDEAMQDNLGRVIATQDTVLLGRRSFEEWAAFWPDSTIQPFADFINHVDKLVVTSAPLTQPWAGASRLEGDLAERIKRLKEAPGGDIGVHASLQLTRSLLQLDLVDQLSLVIAPAVCVEGRRLLDDRLPKRLNLTRSVTSPSGYLLVDYQLS